MKSKKRESKCIQCKWREQVGLATHDIVKYITDNVISEFIGLSCKNLVHGKMESHIFRMTSEERS